MQRMKETRMERKERENVRTGQKRVGREAYIERQIRRRKLRTDEWKKKEKGKVGKRKIEEKRKIGGIQRRQRKEESNLLFRIFT